ncbi:ras-related gtp-binding protein rab11 [Vairimorpha apis BRL 01]|uniref:Ras-related gtp-binding protein rab11 n=1 Tax=Vairimorpha apis BRL 01 TaxID=1037528 RepID=T0MB77_9MICR|nr:ras-related gtp-binding protein rab11 [Vairimorpha apis BRL 01]
MQNSNSHFDYLFKIVLIGDSAVGKTNLLSQLMHNKYNQDSRATIGVEFGTMTFSIDNKIVKAQIWDTAGQERYQAITHAYYRGSAGAIIVYDVTQKITITRAIESWLIQLKNFTENIPIMLIGNKIDLQNKQVSTEYGQDVALRNELMHFETSARTGDNVYKAFYELVLMIYKKHKEKESRMEKKKPKNEFKGKEIKKLRNRKKNQVVVDKIY